MGGLSFFQVGLPKTAQRFSSWLLFESTTKGFPQKKTPLRFNTGLIATSHMKKKPPQVGQGCFLSLPNIRNLGLVPLNFYLWPGVQKVSRASLETSRAASRFVQAPSAPCPKWGLINIPFRAPRFDRGNWFSHLVPIFFLGGFPLMVTLM